jgi:signal transduction histidine kinase
MTSPEWIAIIYFFYGLAFFSMGLAITLEVGKCSDKRMRTALRPLAVFGFLHGVHEWVEMFELLGILHPEGAGHILGEMIRLAMLAWSFLSLAAFGAYLIARDDRQQRYSLLAPVGLVAIWSFGLFILRDIYPYPEIFNVADVWTRYVLAIPAALLACIGLIVQQREFRMAGMEKFGRDSLWAAVAFFWYGLVGQLFTRYSPLPPSTVVNQGLFIELFAFPVQILRAGAAIVASFFVIRFLRAFEVETQRQFDEMRSAQLKDAQQREALRGELLERIVAAQEAERSRIARELHDETGQALTAIGLGLRGVATVLRQDIEKAAHNLRQLEGLVANSLNELQRLIADLRPSHLDDLGLSATLRWYTAELQGRAGVHIHLEFDGDHRELSTDVKTALFRIIQEALNNVIKHADAKNVLVRLNYSDHSVSAIVIDDGRGFSPEQMEDTSRSFGLIGMSERASLLGGNLDVKSEPGKGTQVEVIIPYLENMEQIEYEYSDTVSG